MSAILEPGPYYHNGIEVKAIRDDWHLVEISSKSPAIVSSNSGTYPVPSDIMVTWLQTSGVNLASIAFSEYDVTKLLDDIFGDDSNSMVDVWFENERDALLFKLAWGGR